MELKKRLFTVFGLGVLSLIGGMSPLHARTLAYSKPEKCVVLPWASKTRKGVSPQGPEWFLVDLPKDRLYLESGNDFDVFSFQGRYLKTFSPIDKSDNFYGFTSVELTQEGGLALLARLESPLEQRNKDNFEERARPGARLLVLSPDGKVKTDKEVLDPRQPHSSYWLSGGVVYAVHEDGGFQALEKVSEGLLEDRRFGLFASVADNTHRWLSHLEGLPVFHTKSRTYHDVKGHAHEDKGALAFLLGHPYVEGVGAVAERKGRIFFQILSQKDGEFSNAVFVEESGKRNYGLVELVTPDGEMNLAHGLALYVDPKGNLFEGVAQKDGYYVYRWKALP
ncbi:MAG TPA: hypothetical protein VMV05_05015 [bacterium]|nr:hypothetical protein [bacterium]